MTLVSCAGFLMGCTLGAARLGMLPTIFPPVATKQEVAQLSRDLAIQITAMETTDDNRWADELDSQIISLRARDCHARTDAVKRQYWGMISKRINEWEDATKKETYPLPACSDL